MKSELKFDLGENWSDLWYIENDYEMIYLKWHTAIGR